MKTTAITAMFPIVFLLATGCFPSASDEQIEKMCQNLITLTGEARGTNETEAIDKINEEYALKDESLKKEMARDLKGMDDVLAQALGDIEKADWETEELKAAQKQRKTEHVEKRKKEIRDQFIPLIELLTPQKERAMKDAVEYTKKRVAKAKAAVDQCVSESQKSDLSERSANCRIKATMKDDYFNCR